jgi:subtilisin family serine protease
LTEKLYFNFLSKINLIKERENMKKIVIIFVILLLSICVFATQQNTFELQRLAEKFKTEYEQKRAEAYQKAAQMNWPTTFTTDEGSFAELQILDESGMPKYYITHNAIAAQTISTDEVYTGGSAGLSLSGSGITVHEWDGGGVLLTHQEFVGRVTQVDGPIISHYHSTHVAGTIMASGVVTSAKGMAFAATLRAFDWTNDTSEMASEAALGALISNHSYGYGRGWTYSPPNWYWYGDVSVSTTEDYLFGFYDSDSQQHDQIAYNAPDYLIVKSAGNDRNDNHSGGHYYWNNGWTYSTAYRDPDGQYDCIGTVGVAKNILTVGAVNDITGGYSQPSDVTMSSFSSWGPADDGRIKPDICANGVSLYSTDNDHNSDYTSLSGTSMSSPSVTGSLALLQEYYISQNGSNMLAATLKGLIINTADEAGSNNGPDYQFGWGLMNTESAANVINYNGTTDYILETSLSNGGSFQINFNSNGTTPLVATICWTDPVGTPTTPALNPTTKMLVNDLDMRITKTGSTYYPWKLDVANPSNAATNSGDNNTDNVEKIEISSPTSGEYTISVTHKGTLSSSQNFSLIITGIDPSVLVSTPTFNPPAGTYGTTQSVTINCATSGATIYYTTDGTDPDDTNLVYSSPISISSSQTLKAIAYHILWTPSSIASGDYWIIPDPNTIDITSGAITQTQVGLNWSGSSPEFRVVRTTGGPASTPTSGTLVFEGASTSATASSLTANTTYFFTVFGKESGASQYSNGNQYLCAVTEAVSGATTASVPAGQTGEFTFGTTGSVVNITTNVDPDGGTIDSQKFDTAPSGNNTISGSATAPDLTTVTPNIYASERYWTISSTLTGSNAFTVYFDISGLSGVNDPDKLLILKRDTSGWEAQNTSRDGNMLYSDITSFSDFIIGADSGDNPLPVTLSSFTAVYYNRTPIINWTTQSESNNSGWNIYRSASSNAGQNQQINFELIPGAGTASEPTEYSFIDEYETEFNQTYWYWLESVSGSGETETFGPVTLTIPFEEENTNIIPVQTKLWQNHPNPFNPTTCIKFDVKENEVALLTIFNVKGQIILSQEFEAGCHYYNWDARNYSSGIYLYKLQSPSYPQIKKMVLVK